MLEELLKVPGNSKSSPVPSSVAHDCNIHWFSQLKVWLQLRTPSYLPFDNPELYFASLSPLTLRLLCRLSFPLSPLGFCQSWNHTMRIVRYDSSEIGYTQIKSVRPSPSIPFDSLPSSCRSSRRLDHVLLQLGPSLLHSSPSRLRSKTRIPADNAVNQ